MDNFIQHGHKLTLTAPEGGVVVGGGYQIGQMFVVAESAADADDAFIGLAEGVFTLPRKVADDAWTEGEPVYWDAEDEEATSEGAGLLLIGCAAAAATDNATTGTVRLNGASRPSGVSDVELEDDAVDTGAIQDDAVTTAKIDDAAVTKAKALVFFSTEQTGTGSAQNVAHGLAVAPTGVMVAVTESDGSAFDVAEGTHTTTNVVVTVTTGVKFKVFAWA